MKKMIKASGEDKYLSNLKDLQKLLQEAVESIRKVADLSFGVSNQKIVGDLAKIKDDLYNLLRDTDNYRDELNKKRFKPVELARNPEEALPHQQLPFKR